MYEGGRVVSDFFSVPSRRYNRSCSLSQKSAVQAFLEWSESRRLFQNFSPAVRLLSPLLLLLETLIKHKHKQTHIGISRWVSIACADVLTGVRVGSWNFQQELGDEVYVLAHCLTDCFTKWETKLGRLPLFVGVGRFSWHLCSAHTYLSASASKAAAAGPSAPPAISSTHPFSCPFCTLYKPHTAKESTQSRWLCTNWEEKKREEEKKWHELDELLATVGVRRRGFGGMDALNMKLYMLQSSYSRL
jgi:hypothetical protein